MIKSSNAKILCFSSGKNDKCSRRVWKFRGQTSEIFARAINEYFVRVIEDPTCFLMKWAYVNDVELMALA
jgi:hypothetical protein